MSPTQRWLGLSDRIAELNSTFIPVEEDSENDEDPAEYDQSTHDNAAAFLLLAHAAIESFIEGCCEEAAASLVATWKQNDSGIQRVLALLAFSDGPNQLKDDSYSLFGMDNLEVDKVIIDAHRLYCRIIVRNNGLKESNLRRLLLPLGIDPSEVSDEFLADMNKLGSTRGEHAHEGLGARVLQDPVESRELLSRIMDGLESLNDRLQEL